MWSVGFIYRMNISSVWPFPLCQNYYCVEVLNNGNISHQYVFYSAFQLLCHPILISFVGWMAVNRIRWGKFQRLNAQSPFLCILFFFLFPCLHCNLNIPGLFEGVSNFFSLHFCDSTVIWKWPGFERVFQSFLAFYSGFRNSSLCSFACSHWVSQSRGFLFSWSALICTYVLLRFLLSLLWVW